MASGQSVVGQVAVSLHAVLGDLSELIAQTSGADDTMQDAVTGVRQLQEDSDHPLISDAAEALPTGSKRAVGATSCNIWRTPGERIW